MCIILCPNKDVWEVIKVAELNWLFNIYTGLCQLWTTLLNTTHGYI